MELVEITRTPREVKAKVAGEEPAPEADLGGQVQAIAERQDFSAQLITFPPGGKHDEISGFAVS